jgi:hypothetical protein
MLPEVQTGNSSQRRRQRRFRPITPRDNAATTGLAVNPVGAMIPANPNPGTQMYGQQGQFGAMLPSGNRGVPPLQIAINAASNWANAGGSISNPYLNRWSNQPTIQPVNLGPLRGTYGQLPGGVGIPRINPPTAGQAQPPISATPSQPDYKSLPAHQTSSGISAGTTEIIQRIFENPDEFNNLPKASQDAVEKLLRQGQTPGTVTNAAGTGSVDFMDTDFMQEYAAQETLLENQLRWDPQRKKYVKIGRLIAEGRLNVRDRNARLRRRKRGGGGGGGGGGSETASGFTGSFGVVNFNTATG